MGRHALAPLHYDTKINALNHLIPSLDIPSDHMPVIVDFDIAYNCEGLGVSREYSATHRLLKLSTEYSTTH
eukprot:8617962-Pyramimonas_sp.AAC.1